MSNLSSCSLEDCDESGSDGSDSRLSPEETPAIKKKQKQYKTPTGSTAPQPMLPPCRICGEKASGFHYGANTCEACKTFFRRNMRKEAQFACPATGNCRIMSDRRSSCAACRLKKCFSIGMSKSAIKTGRYTHAKKAKDIMEVKALTKEPAVCPEPELSESDVSNQSELQTVAPSLPTEREPSNAELSEDELDEIIQHMTAVQARFTSWTPDVIAKQADRERLYLEHKTLRQQIFGPLKTVTEEEYMRIYHTTGIEIDGRRELVQSYEKTADEEIRRNVKFVKEIPGFRQLSIEDQTALFKFEKLFTNSDGYVISLDDASALTHSDEMEMLFELQRKLQKLGLKEEENCILAALCVVFADVSNLEDADQVLRCQSLLRRCLLRLMDKYHRDDPLFIARVVAILVEMRTVGEIFRHAELQVGMRWADKVDVPPLLSEIWSTL